MTATNYIQGTKKAKDFILTFKILCFIRNNPNCSINNIIENLNCNRNVIYRMLHGLEDTGLIHCKRVNRFKCYRSTQALDVLFNQTQTQDNQHD